MPRALLLLSIVAIAVVAGRAGAGAQERHRVLLPLVHRPLWQTVAPLARARGTHGVAEAGGKVYAFGGQSYGSARFSRETLASVEEYDPATERWRARTAMPSPRSRFAGASAGGRVYAIGGEGVAEALLASVDEYDPAADAWRSRMPMPTARTAAGAAELNGLVYVAGGDPDGISTDGPFLATLDVYDPAADAWRSRAPMPTGRRNVRLAAGANGRLYALGGYNGSILATVEEYDPATDSWRARAPMPTARATFGAATAPNGRIYVVGGQGGIGSFLANVEEYDPVANTWTAHDDLTVGRAGLGAAFAGGRLYAVGGYRTGGSDTDILAVVEEGAVAP
jgi:N-acetylneuraminic acid mutarotase